MLHTCFPCDFDYWSQFGARRIRVVLNSISLAVISFDFREIFIEYFRALKFAKMITAFKIRITYALVHSSTRGLHTSWISRVERTNIAWCLIIDSSYNWDLQFQPILIDGRGHLLGRLAAIIAKTVLQGNKVVVVRSEQLNISGNFFRLVNNCIFIICSWVFDVRSKQAKQKSNTYVNLFKFSYKFFISLTKRIQWWYGNLRLKFVCMTIVMQLWAEFIK